MVLYRTHNQFENIHNYIDYTYISHRRVRLALNLWIVIVVAITLLESFVHVIAN